MYKLPTSNAFYRRVDSLESGVVDKTSLAGRGSAIVCKCYDNGTYVGKCCKGENHPQPTDKDAKNG